MSNKERTMTTKEKKSTLRQRLRDDAAIELDELMKAGHLALTKVAGNTGVTQLELAKMIGGTQTDTLESKLITKLADRKEARLEELYLMDLEVRE